ncbi:MAG TPA: MFS transporter [Steroidobacteraceae bacterium]|nr:MFS transporter [Steroidobacteraceae bacterium]
MTRTGADGAVGARDDTLTRNVRRLLAARTVRSVGQGVTVASFSLYLHSLGYSGTAIGTVLMAGLAFGIVMTIVVGPLSDRRGRRPMLLAYEAAAAGAALAAMISPDEAVLIVAATIAGFGRGANGAAGPFAPVEQAWIAREVDGAARGRALSLNATLGFLGMATGAALVAVPAMFGRGFADLASYRLLFLVPFTGSLLAIALIGGARESATPPAAALDAAAQAAAAQLTRSENRNLRRLALSNAINGSANGIIGPLMAYWFARRFGEPAAMIGPAMALGFVLAALGSILSRGLISRFGAVASVVRMRIVGLAALFAMPFAPLFGEAVSLYALRAAFNHGTLGARQTVAADLTRPERRGLAASVQTLSAQIPRAAGPVLGGWLIHSGRFATPFFIATALQALYLYLYRRFFGALDAADA